jgi:hypothetical protein
MNTGRTSLKFQQLVKTYENTAQCNDRLWNILTDYTWSDPILSKHRRYFEDNRLGFGDAAFQAMWLLLLGNAHDRFGMLRALEIGVFKGQIISLWALVEKNWGIKSKISAITPLEGHLGSRSRLAL